MPTVGGRAFPVAGPTICSSLPDNVISAASLSTFGQRRKTFLLSVVLPDVINDNSRLIPHPWWIVKRFRYLDRSKIDLLERDWRRRPRLVQHRAGKFLLERRQVVVLHVADEPLVLVRRLTGACYEALYVSTAKKM